MMEQTAQPELPNIVTFLAGRLSGTPWAKFLYLWENVIFSLIIVFILSLVAYLASRKTRLIPQGLQNAVEAVVEMMDDFARGILGEKGRKYTPFIGTLFIYILFMNLFGLVPFMKSPTASWSTTLALSICVFLYVQYTAVRELGFLGYIDHLAGKPRGVLAFSAVLPVMMFLLHVISEIIKPISLSLRLRSNVWGDDVLLAVLSGFGLTGVPLLFFNMVLAVLTAVVQAVVFSLLTTIYFALVLTHDEKTSQNKEVISGR
ncbi:MAG: F0F1 ATP synthase subunit A [Candidatus Omnitrophica bacterium]|nr:F0F1 ATP synthase subunit A [Candidatus Omnitrophota bacterium]